MQRIKTVRYQARNIGGDRCFAKLRYVRGQGFAPPVAQEAAVMAFPFNVGAQQTGHSHDKSISGFFGTTPNLSTLARFYTKYRIRGIKIRLTAYYIPDADDPPLVLFTTAQTSAGPTFDSEPTPPFPPPNIDDTPEQRWTKYKVVSNQGAGGAPTSISAYYSVNKVFGPDNCVKNDSDFIGDLITGPPYWSDAVPILTDYNRPTKGPWLMYGFFTLDGAKLIPTTVNLTLKTEVTLYTEMFSKRPAIA